jgi:hypothetical protein
MINDISPAGSTPKPGPVQAHPSSYRDRDGFLFWSEGRLLRQINRRGQPAYERLMASGLYAELVDRGWLVPHRESDHPPAQADLVWKVIEPERIPFVSYPYEWCFSQLRDAALLTLRIQKAALARGMILKDASAFNVQFDGIRPVFIDTLSFAVYEEGKPWAAYRQFCEHFLAPMALVCRCDERLGALTSAHLEGVPLDLASRLLPWRSWLRPGLLLHVHLHSIGIRRGADRAAAAREARLSRQGLEALMGSLEQAASGLKWSVPRSAWSAYYEEEANYAASAMARKAYAVGRMLDTAQPRMIWDIGANTGLFSRLAADKGAYVVAMDADRSVTELHYLECRRGSRRNVLPLVMDAAAPSPGLGWSNAERASLRERGPADVVMMLALVHHLAISRNVPMVMLAEYAAELGRRLIVEFVPKNDSNAQRLLAVREDIFDDYSEEGFESAFGRFFLMEQKSHIEGTDRTLYLYRKSRP